MTKKPPEPEQTQATQPTLGAYLRDCRLRRALTSRQLASRAGLEQPTVIRIETGHIRRPRPDILAKLAEALELDVADLFARANYTAPTGLPTLTPYLRTKYKNLPAEDIARIQAYAQKLADRHGIALAGPTAGEDERDDETQA